MDSKSLNIGIFISSDFVSGGGFQYEYKVLELLKKFHNDKNIKLYFYGIFGNIENDYSCLGLNIKIIRENKFNRLHRDLLSNLFLYKIFSRFNFADTLIEKELHKDNIDLVFFLSSNPISLGLNNIPYIFTLWDLGHFDVLGFPEVGFNREFEKREDLLSKSLKKAFRVIVSLENGKKRAIEKYKLDEDRVEVLKFLPNLKAYSEDPFIDIKQKYGVLNNYIFYPAQFWAHKNHIYILKAIQILREDHDKDIDVIFSGTDKGNLKYIEKRARELNINDLIHFIGYVPNEEIPFLYKQSLALVMPTYLGPTNIPPLEAFAYGVPVCYSDIPSFREQVGDAAFFMDLRDPRSLVEHINTIESGNALVEIKKDLGRGILNEWKEIDFYKKLISIFSEYKYLRDLWD